jgi:hypothetical protein
VKTAGDDSQPTNTRKRACSNTHGDDGEQKAVREEKEVTNMIEDDEMETDTPKGDFWAGHTPSPAPSPPRTLVPPTITEKLADEDVATNNAVLAHLKAKAAKQKAVRIQKAPPTPPPDPIHSEDDSLLFTPTSSSKFPPVHGYTSTRIFDNLDHEQMSVWLTLESPHIFVQPLCHGYYPPNIAPEMVHLIRETIQLALGTTGIKVTAPSPNEAVTKLNKAPFTYLVRGMSVAEADRLVAKHCLASKTIGLLIYKAGIEAPSYLGSIQGLTIDDHEDHESVLQLVAQTYFQGSIGTILAEISTLHPEFPTQPADTDRVHNILQTLEGRKLELSTGTGSKRTCFNLYIQSPTKDDDDWARLLQAVTSTIYKHALLGNGFHGSPWNCNTCHDVDHPSGLCPFPLLPGWFKAGTLKTIVDFHTSVSHDISRQAAAERAQRDTSHGWGTPHC